MYINRIKKTVEDYSRWNILIWFHESSSFILKKFNAPCEWVFCCCNNNFVYISASSHKLYTMYRWVSHVKNVYLIICLPHFSLTKKEKKKKAKKLAPLRSADQAYDSDNRSTNLSSSMRGTAPLPLISSTRRPEPLGQTGDSEDERRRGGYDDRSDGEGTEDDERNFLRKRGSISGPGKGKRGSLSQVRDPRRGNKLI